MTATETATATATRPPVLLPGRRSELSRAEAEFFAPTKAGDDSGSGFAAFLDVINPLQHIPVVSTLYRELTGDTISPAARIAGGALYGGPIGAGIAIVGAIAEQVTGESPDQMMASALGFGDTPGATAVAAASRPAPSGLIAEATTRPAEPAAPPPVVLASADGPAKNAPPKTTTPATATAAIGVPQMSPAAFDALIRAMGGQPAGAEAAAATAAAEAVAPSVLTASAGTTEERRFFPARQNGTRAPRPVPMDLRPAEAPAYDDALRQMRQNIDRYTSVGIAAGGTGAAP